MEALANGAIRALNKEELLEYTGKPIWNGFDFEPEEEMTEKGGNSELFIGSRNYRRYF